MAGETSETEGTVLEALPSGMYRVELATGQNVVAHVGGTARLKVVRILPGDRVRVAVSPFDGTRGRITGRIR